MPPIKIAIIDSNVLTGIGLQNLLEEILPMADITVLRSFSEIENAAHEQYAHFFVSSIIYFEHTQFFREHPVKSIVLVNGEMSISGVFTLNVCQDETALVRDIFNLHRMGHGTPEAKGGSHHSMDGKPSHSMTGGMPPHGHPSMAMGMPPHGHASADDSKSSQEQSSTDASMPPHGHPAHLASMPPHAYGSAPKQFPLSKREIEVAILLSKGLINKEIADRLNISITTVITHRKNIMDKLRARSLADIIIYTVMNGLVDVGEL